MRLENKQINRSGAIGRERIALIVKSFEEIEKRAEKACAGSVFVLSGEEYCQSARVLSALRKRASELSYEPVRIMPDDLPEISLRSLFTEGSLFSPGKLVIISSVDKIPASSKKELISVLESGTEHILFARTEGRKPSNAFIRSLEKTGTGFTCWDPFPNRMWLWTKKLAEEEGITFTRDGGQAAEAIAAGKLERLSDVVSRVALFHGRGKTANASHVYAAVKGVQETTAFKFCEMALSGKKSGAMTSLALLLKAGEEPIRLLALFYSQWKQAAYASELMKNGLSPVATAKKMGIPQFRWKTIEPLTRSVARSAKSSVLEAFAVADHELKTGGDPLASIGHIVLTLTIGR